MQTQNKKMEYMAPMVELIEVRVEKGFQNSTTDELRNEGMEQVGDSGNNYDNTLFT